MSWEIKTKVRNLTKDRVELERSSKEFMIKLAIDFSEPELKGNPKSGIKLVDGILNNTNFVLELSADGIENRSLLENVGFALGEGLRKIHRKRKEKETGSFVETDKKKMCMFAINAKKHFGEANLQIIGKPEFNAEYFFAFFDGFAQGFGSEVSAVINVAADQKDHMRFVSRAFAGCLEGIFG